MFHSSNNFRRHHHRSGVTANRHLSRTIPAAYFRRLQVEPLETRDLLTATISGRVWNEANFDFLQSPGETGMPYAVAELFNTVNGNAGDGDDVSLGTRMTGADGAYQFTSLPAANTYYVIVRSPAGFVFCPSDQGDDSIDSDVSGSGQSNTITPADGATVHIDAGLVGNAPAFGWANSIGGAGLDVANQIKVDAAGNSYVAGVFNGTVDFDPGSGVRSMTSAGSEDVFLAKYSMGGALVWAAQLGGTGHDEAGDLALADDGSVLLTGGFKGSVDFDPGPNSTVLTASNISYQAYVWKLTSDGNLVWARSLGQTATQSVGYGIAVDAQGNVVTTGMLQGTADFDPGTGTKNLNSPSGGAYVWRLDAGGNLGWAVIANTVSGSFTVRGLAAAYDSFGNVLIGGTIPNGQVDFDPGSGTSLLTSTSSDAFIWKLSPAGNLIWAKGTSGTAGGLRERLAVDAEDNVYLVGAYGDVTDFDPSGATDNLTGGTNGDVFVWKLSKDGLYRWARRMGSSGADWAYDIAIDSRNYLVIVGAFAGTVDIDPTSAIQQLTSAGDKDGFVWTLNDNGMLLSAQTLGLSGTEGIYAVDIDSTGDVRIAGAFNDTVDLDPTAAAQVRATAGAEDAFLARWKPIDTGGIVAGRVWNDTNNDGIQSAGEASVQYAAAELIFSADPTLGDDDDVSLGTEITGADGIYRFEDVAPGSRYYVTIRPAPGFTFAATDAGGNDALDSDVSNVGRTGLFIPLAGETFDIDAGLVGTSAEFGWAQTFGSSGVEWGIAPAIDDDGNIYLTGAFNNTVDVDAGPGTINLTSQALNDIFVTKYTPTGALVWAVSAGSPVQHEQGNAVAVMPDGGVVVTGTMRGTMDFDPGPSQYNLTSASNEDIFVWRLSSQGKLVWARRAGAGSSESGFGIAVNDDGQIAVTGSFANTVDFDPGTAIVNVAAQGSTDVFVWTLDEQGNLVWVVRAGRSSFGTVGRQVAYDSQGNLLVTGWFGGGPADFDPGTGTANLTGFFNDVFVWKLSPTGSLVWVKSAGNTSSDQGYGLAIDANDNVIVTGLFGSTVDFDPGDGVQNLTASGSDSDIFVWKLSSAGEYVWANRAGSTGNHDQGLAVAVDGNGDVVVTGDFLGTVDFDPGTETKNLVSSGDTEAFVWKLSSAGNLLFADKIGASGGDSGRGVAVDAAGMIYVTGYYVGTVDFAYGASTKTLTGPGFQDMFLARWNVTASANQAPTFTKGADQTVNENSGVQTVPGWATGITTGGESGQSLAFTATVDPAWGSYAGGPQHTAVSLAPSQKLSTIHWQTPMDLNPQYSGELLLAHYGSPLISAANTVIIPVKTGATDGFKVEARSGADGTLKWSQTTDYLLPPHNWVPSYAPTLTPRGRLYYAGAGGTVFYTDNVDSNSPGAPVRLAFYGLASYDANTSTYNSSVFINTPITSDAAGNIYFGFDVTGANPLGLTDGIARIAPDGTATYISTTAASGDVGLTKVAMNAAPALSNDGSTLYVVVSSGNYGRGSLLALNSTTLALVASTPLMDPGTGNNATIADNGTSSPTVGPDGDVYIGVLERPIGSNDYRGWLLHFSGNLSQSKPAGAFGWDITPSVVPASMVPSYTGSSSYLVMTKYNHYAGAGGDGVNKLAILDPNATMTDPVSGVTVMKEVLTIAGVTPDVDILAQYPNAVREWCINTAVVDPSTGSILVNSEDGKLYRWSLATNTFTESIVLTAGLGQAYTPTLLGPDGTIYAINDAKLFAVGSSSPPAFSRFFSVPPSVNPATGTLTYQVAPNVYGSARITLTLSDGGGTANGGADTSEPQTFLITSVPSELRVTKVTPTATGFVAEFNRALNPSELSLYEQDGLLGAVDLTLIGNANGTVQGSLVVDAGLKKITFIKTGGPLFADTYQLTLRSASNAFKDAQAGLLDGNFDSAPGDNYQAMFVASAPVAEAIRVSVPDFARGFGQTVNVPATASTGLPITVSKAVGVRSVSFTLRYDPTLLTISGATLGPNITGTVNFNVISPGVVQISVLNAAGLSGMSGSQTLVNLAAQVPASAEYGSKEILDITALQVFDTSVTPVELPSIDDDGIHVAAYVGDANGSQSYNAPDATFTQRLIVGTNSGLLSYQLADPRLIVDINSNGLIQADDVTAIQRAVVGTYGDIPVQPSLPAPGVGGPDPVVSIPQNLTASVGQSISVPVELLVTEPTGIDLAGVDLAIAYDPTALELTRVDIGTLLVGFGLNVNTSTPGVIRLSLAGSSLLSLQFDAFGLLAMLQFTVLPGAGTGTAINLLADDGLLRTALYDRAGIALTLQPAPSNAADDLVDGLISIVEPSDWADAVDAALAEW